MNMELAETLYAEAMNAIAVEERNKKVHIATWYLGRLKELVLSEGFSSQQEEIRFFKEIKPRFCALVMFYSKLDQLELARPEAIAQIREFYEQELNQTQRFFIKNTAVYSYYRSSDTHMDEQLFMRGKVPPRWFTKPHVDVDERFSSAADLLFARIVAKEQLVRYLEGAIEGREFTTFSEKEPETRWTGDSINLLENVFGWYLTGQVNHGQATLADLVRKVEKVFGVKLDKPYRRFSEIRQRKRLSKTKFMDEMSVAILKKIEDEDEYKPG